MDIVAGICLILIVCELYELNKRFSNYSKDKLTQLYLIQCELKAIRDKLPEKEKNENKSEK